VILDLPGAFIAMLAPVKIAYSYKANFVVTEVDGIGDLGKLPASFYFTCFHVSPFFFLDKKNKAHA